MTKNNPKKPPRPKRKQETVDHIELPVPSLDDIMRTGRTINEDVDAREVVHGGKGDRRTDVRDMMITPADIFNKRSWRADLDGTHLKFDDERKAIFLQHLAATNRWTHAARAAGVSLATVTQHRDNDIDFGDACELAITFYKEHCQEALYEQAIVGIFQPIFDKDGHRVGFKREVNGKLLELELKRLDPAYRDRQTVDVNVQRGGVLEVPSKGGSPEAWEENLKKLSQDQHGAMERLVEQAERDNKMIDVTPKEQDDGE